MTLDYLHIPVVVLMLPGLSLREKLLLGLVISFDNNGLKISNESLGEILNVWPSRVSRLLKNLEQKGYVKIKNSQSRYRVIYLLQSAKVDVLLATLDTPTVAQSRNRIKGSKSLSKNRERAHFQKPTPGEVSKYAKTIGYTLDGEYFCDTYEARGWMVGRSLMRDWKAAVRTWKSREGSQNGNRNIKVGTDSAKPNPVARSGEFIR